MSSSSTRVSLFIFLLVYIFSHRQLLTKLNQFSLQQRTVFDYNSRIWSHQYQASRHVLHFSIHCLMWAIIWFDFVFSSYPLLRPHRAWNSLKINSIFQDSHFNAPSHEWTGSNVRCWFSKDEWSISVPNEISTAATAASTSDARSNKFHDIDFQWKCLSTRNDHKCNYAIDSIKRGTEMNGEKLTEI